MSYEMPPDPTDPRRTARLRRTGRRPRALIPTLAVLVVLLILFGLFTSLYTDLLWYRSIGFARVFATQALTKTALFIVFGAVMAGAIGGTFALAYRHRPVYAPMSQEQQNLERYRTNIEPFHRLILIGVPALLGLFAGSAASGEWQKYLLWRNGQTFGAKDPQFGIDLSFFAFDLPWYRFVLGFAFAVVILSLLVAAATHYLYGGLRLQSPGERTTPAARVHLSVLLGVFVLLKAIAYWLDRYSLAVKGGQVGATDFVGLTYTDVNAVLPAKAILAAISVICAVLFFVNAFRRGWLLPGIGVALLLLSAIIIGSIYPAVVQRFTVRPSAQVKEASYIARGIENTRNAYKIAGTQTSDYTAQATVSQGQLRDDADTIPGIRLLDPAVVSPTFRALQQVRGFYDFPDVLDVDRYQVAGVEQDSVVGVRELSLAGVPRDQRNWANDHINFTHGFGFVAAKGNTRDPGGAPTFFERDIPPTGALGDFQPRIYFGEESPTYSIVGGPAGGPQRELDYPDDASPTGAQSTTYTGAGGVAIGSLFRQVLYAAKYQQADILLSDLVNGQSKILYDRMPRDRVQKAAPWLKLDGNSYPAVVGGRVVWILDGYTTSNAYPYSKRTSLETATTDALTGTSSVVAQRNEQVNYIRNSVKATVDAYDGTVTLYQWDTQDPVLKTWMKAFPGSVKPLTAISDALTAHLRYPEDLFKVQRTLLAQYHVEDPQAFFRGEDFWRVPNDPTTASDAKVEQPPYYLTLRMPGQDAPAFSLTTTFVPNAENRSNLTAFAAVNAEPGDEYGTIRLLTLPRSSTVPGPGQVQNSFETNPVVAQTLSLLRQGGSDVVNGNLLTLPVGGGLLYVEPVYVQAKGGGTSYPLLRKVLVAFGDQVGFEDTLQAALDSVFAGNAGAGTNEPPVTGSDGTPPPTSTASPSPTTPAPSGTASPDPAGLAAALADMKSAVAAGQAALAQGDFAAYGAAQRQLLAALDRAIAAQGGVRSTPATSAAPSPSLTPIPAPTAAG